MPRPTWTPEQARAFGEKGREAKRLAQERKRQYAATIVTLAHDNGYASALHARMRALLDMVMSRGEEEAGKATCDGQKLNWLASALERLAELERILAGRPLPGSRRPPPQDTPPSKQPPTPPTPMPVSAPPITRTIPSATPPPNTPADPTPPTPLLSEPPDW